MRDEDTDPRTLEVGLVEPVGATASAEMSSSERARRRAGTRGGRTILGIGYIAFTAVAALATPIPTALGLAGCYPEQVSRAIAIVAAFTIICGLAPGIVLLPFLWDRIPRPTRARAMIIPVVVLMGYGLFTLAWVGMLAIAFRDPTPLSALMILLSSTAAVTVSTALMISPKLRAWVRATAWLASTAVLTSSGVVGVLLLASTGRCG